MKQCKECGTICSDETAFCSTCGTKFLAIEIKEVHKRADGSNIERKTIENTEDSDTESIIDSDSIDSDIQNICSNSETSKKIAITVFVTVAIIAILVIIFTIATKSGKFDDRAQYENEISLNSNAEYIFPSDSQYLTKEQLNKLTKEEIVLLRNEIYARHGYVFKSNEYRTYFESKSWYKPNKHFDESMFNSIEKANKDLIVKYEIEKGWR